MRVIGKELRTIAPCALMRLMELSKLWNEQKICASGPGYSLIELVLRQDIQWEALLLEDTFKKELVAFVGSDFVDVTQDAEYSPVDQRYKIVEKICISKDCSDHGGQKGMKRCQTVE